MSLRDVEELLAERGITLSYETVGHWVRTFGPIVAKELRRRCSGCCPRLSIGGTSG